ncbi:unnamed protein product [Effrenium voratum]|nr:unnamed protein product [Effrenium voratum]
MAVQLAARRLAMPAQTRRNSFIKQVMEQVKKDMEADPKLRKDFEQVQKSSERMKQKTAMGGEQLEQLGDKVKSLSSKTSELLSSWTDKARSAADSTSSRLDQAAADNEALKRAREALKSASASTSAASSSLLNKTRERFSTVMDVSSKAVNFLGDEDKKAARTKQWKQARDAFAEEQKAKEEKTEMKEGEEAEDTKTKAADAAATESALVVSQARSSSWDRFGAGLRDMPFLNSVFENPLLDRVFGETEIAASIREMKAVDYSFRLEEFAEDMEYLVAPHIIKAYLEGDSEALKKHCGDSCFNAVNAGIKERVKQKLTLDTAILAGPREVELKGAKLSEQGPPCFIWTFNMQQVNCLRDAEGEIIEGAVDDIRTVCYAMAVTRHPEQELDLEYPWQVSELAILWNQPCF